jgi:3'-5' exoribonuclease
MAASHYPHIDCDLLLTGAVLHDIGKIYELSYDRGFGYSDEGQLLGHIQISLRLIADKLRLLPDFPPRLRALVEHMILSHHGRLEFGSPKVPHFPEALLLHFLDDMDSKMECMRALIERDRHVDGCFTGYNAALERTVLKKNRYMNPPPVAERIAKPAAASNGSAGDTEVKRPVAPPSAASHPLFPPRPNSPFGEKLQLALRPSEPKQGS